MSEQFRITETDLLSDGERCYWIERNYQDGTDWHRIMLVTEKDLRELGAVVLQPVQLSEPRNEEAGFL